jgi:hypothetical protein
MHLLDGAASEIAGIGESCCSACEFMWLRGLLAALRNPSWRQHGDGCTDALHMRIDDAESHHSLM